MSTAMLNSARQSSAKHWVYGGNQTLNTVKLVRASNSPMLRASIHRPNLLCQEPLRFQQALLSQSLLRSVADPKTRLQVVLSISEISFEDKIDYEKEWGSKSEIFRLEQ